MKVTTYIDASRMQTTNPPEHRGCHIKMAYISDKQVGISHISLL